MSALARTHTPDFATARFHMVEAQLRANKVRDERILSAMGSLPREHFVPPLLAGVAYVDEDIEVSPGRYLLEPMILARLLQDAGVTATDNVLDVAPATGYSSALLAMLAKDVTALESDHDLATTAAKNFLRLPVVNVRVVQMPMNVGCSAHAPYDVIVINGSVDHIPNAFFAELAEGGRLVAVVTNNQGVEPVGEARLYEKRHGMVSHRALFNANVKPLREFAAKLTFVF